MLGASTMPSMPAENNVREAKKWVYRRSPLTYSVRIDLDEQRDEGDDPEQHHRQAVDTGTDGELEPVVRPPHPRAHDRLDERLGTVTFGHARHDRLAERPDRSTASSLWESAELVRWIHCNAVPVASTSEMVIDVMAISAPLNGMRLPIPMMRANPIAGTSAMSQAFSRNQPELSWVASADSTSALHL